METLVWRKDKGFVSVIKFENGNYGVATNVQKSRKGAEKQNARVRELCGENWELRDFIWDSTNDEGVTTTHYYRKNGQSL
jgi:hypothetical protein